MVKWDWDLRKLRLTRLNDVESETVVPTSSQRPVSNIFDQAVILDELTMFQVMTLIHCAHTQPRWMDSVSQTPSIWCVDNNPDADSRDALGIYVYLYIYT